MNEQAIDIVIRAKDEATKALNKIKGTAKSLSGTLETVGKVSAVAFAGLTAVIYKGKEAIEEDAEATNRLTKLLKTASKATDEQVSSLIAQAEALEKTTVAGYDMIATTQSQLATFNLQADTIEKLTPAILDYVVAEKGATASAEDYRSMTNGLAQALNGNFASLTKSGFVLDEHTKNLIKNGTEAERAAALAQVLGSTYQGFAEGATQTAIGRQIMLNKTLEDVSKMIASQVIPIIDELKLRVLLVAQEVLRWTEEHPELTKNLILVAGAVAGLGASLLVIMPILSGVWTAITTGIVVVKALGAALLFLTTNPIGILMTALVALGLALYTVWKNWESVKLNLILLWEQISRDVSAILDIMRAYIFGVFDSITSFVTEKIDYLKNKAKEAKEFLSSIMSSYTQSSAGQFLSKPGEALGNLVYGQNALGGSQVAGQPYLVGERGPEIIIPKSASTVTPNNKLGMGGISINMGSINVYNEADENRLIQKMKNALRQEAKNYNLGIA